MGYRTPHTATKKKGDSKKNKGHTSLLSTSLWRRQTAVGAEPRPRRGPGGVRKRAPCGAEGPARTLTHALPHSLPCISGTFSRSRLPRMMHVGWQSKPPAACTAHPGTCAGAGRGRQGGNMCGKAGRRGCVEGGAPRGLAARAGRTRLYAGQGEAYAVWNGPARRPRTRRERSTGQGVPSRAPTTGCQNRDFGPRHSAFARPGGAGGKGRAHPTICGAERGAYGVERAGPLQASAAGALYRAGGPPLLFPSDPGFLDSYVPTALHLRPPPPGAGGEGGGGPGCVRGRVRRRRGEGVEKAGRLGEGGADRRRVLSSGGGRVCCVF